MATSHTFTPFPRLPLEIRNMIWDRAGSTPRNLDIWVEKEIDDSEILHFKFISQQPFPGVLLANKESRAATSDKFQPEFRNMERGGSRYGNNCKFSNSSIMRNPVLDRICPMGVIPKHVAWEMFEAVPASSCAINVYFNSEYGYSPKDPLEKIMFWQHGKPKDIHYDKILLYFCDTDKLPPITRPFELVPISEEAAMVGEWKALEKAKQLLHETFHKDLTLHRLRIHRKHTREGKPDPTEAELDPGWHFPELKAVALVLNCVRY